MNVMLCCLVKFVIEALFQAAFHEVTSTTEVPLTHNSRFMFFHSFGFEKLRKKIKQL